MSTREIDITDHQDRFIASQVAAGGYRDASEVVQAGLRLLEQQTLENEQRLALLRKLAQEGLDEIRRGEAIEFENPEAFRNFLQSLPRGAAASSSQVA